LVPAASADDRGDLDRGISVGVLVAALLAAIVDARIGLVLALWAGDSRELVRT